MAGQPEFPYTPVPESLKRLLEKIPSVGTPNQADPSWLSALGFGGGNNRMNLALLKQVGILDNSGKPTDLYKALRAKDRAKVGAGIKAAYATLFEMFPDAHRQDDEALMTYARSKTTYAESVQRLAVRTFKAFVGFGDFDSATVEDTRHADRGHTDEPSASPRTRSSRVESAQGNVGLTVNIQLQLPPSADGEIYDKLFAAMAKHLKGLVSLG